MGCIYFNYCLSMAADATGWLSYRHILLDRLDNIIYCISCTTVQPSATITTSLASNEEWMNESIEDD